MSVLLYSLSGSVFAWRVHLAFEYKGIAHELETLDSGRGENRTEAYLAMNPHGKVPVIRDGDFTLYESTAILEYLEERMASPVTLALRTSPCTPCSRTLRATRSAGPAWD